MNGLAVRVSSLLIFDVNSLPARLASLLVLDVNGCLARCEQCAGQTHSKKLQSIKIPPWILPFDIGLFVKCWGKQDSQRVKCERGSYGNCGNQRQCA